MWKYEQTPPPSVLLQATGPSSIPHGHSVPTRSGAPTKGRNKSVIPFPVPSLLVSFLLLFFISREKE